MKFWPLLVMSLISATSATAQDRCPITTPPTPRFEPPAENNPIPDATEPSAFWYGTREFWTRLRIDGRFARRDKMFWWRPGYNGAVEQRPSIAISIRRVGGAVATSVDARSTNAFFGGAWSMLTMFEFPEAGCWEVTATYTGHQIRFVTLVE
jgi:hypothetical protein